MSLSKLRRDNSMWRQLMSNSVLKVAPFGRWDGAKARRPLT